MKTVFVVGAGPAGLYASNKIAQAGHRVVIINRDIKPGGLAEYGIYPMKDKMKGGLRKQFAKIMSLPNVYYYGHVPVGEGYTLHLDELRQFNPSAIVFAVGAQGTKKLGLPGEEAKGVYAAKDFVYHYNRLPLMAGRDFSTGKRVAIVGMGNVMVDIARWLLEDDPDRKTEEVVVVARRGPFEAKFDEKEFDHIDKHLCRAAFEDELARLKDKLWAADEDVSKVADTTFPILKREYKEEGPRLKFRFLSSPKSIHTDASGRIDRLELTENVLVHDREKNTFSAKATDQTSMLEVDTMIFAIGDVADPKVGLPYGKDAYITNPDTKDAERAAYEVFDPKTGSVVEGTFVVGWARKASEGLVGVARFDAEHGAAHVLKYLESAPERTTADTTDLLKLIGRRGVPVVPKEDLAYLGQAEQRIAQERGLTYFKFADDASMLEAIEEEKTKSPVPVTNS
jgi:ferredoxin--NADP+ reductase